PQTSPPPPPPAPPRHIPSATPPANPPAREPPARSEPSSPTVSFPPDIAARLEEVTGLKVVRDEPMSKHNSLRIGGPASMFVTATTLDELVSLILFARKRNLPYLVIGNGTNILVGDYGIDALVIYNETQQISHEQVDEHTS